MLEYNIQTREVFLTQAAQNIVNKFAEKFYREMKLLFDEYQEIIDNKPGLMGKVANLVERKAISTVVKQGTKSLVNVVGKVAATQTSTEIPTAEAGMFVSVLAQQLLHLFWKHQDKKREAIEKRASDFFRNIKEIHKQESSFFKRIFGGQKNQKDGFDTFANHVLDYAKFTLRYTFAHLSLLNPNVYKKIDQDLATLAQFFAANACALLIDQKRQSKFFPKDDAALQQWIREQLIPPEEDPSFFKVSIRKFVCIPKKLHCSTPYVGKILDESKVKNETKQKLAAFMQGLSKKFDNSREWTLEGLFYRSLQYVSQGTISINVEKYSWKYPPRLFDQSKEYKSSSISARQSIGGNAITVQDERKYYTPSIFSVSDKNAVEPKALDKSLIEKIEAFWKQFAHQKTTKDILLVRDKKRYYRYLLHTVLINFDSIEPQSKAQRLVEVFYLYMKYLFLEYYTICHTYKKDNVQIIYDPVEALSFANEMVWLTRVYTDAVKSSTEFDELFKAIVEKNNKEKDKTKSTTKESVKPYELYIVLKEISEYQLQQCAISYPLMPKEYQVSLQPEKILNSLAFCESSTKHLRNLIDGSSNVYAQFQKSEDNIKLVESYTPDIGLHLQSVKEFFEITEVQLKSLPDANTDAPHIQALIFDKNQALLQLHGQLKELHALLFRAGLIVLGDEENSQQRQRAADFLNLLIQKNLVTWNIRTGSGHTLLHTACACAHFTVEIAVGLLKQVAEEEKQQHKRYNLNEDFLAYDGSTILHSAALSGNPELIKLIFKYRPEIDVDKQNLLYGRKIVTNDPNKDQKDTVDHGIRTALHVAAQSAIASKLAVMQLLLEKGANVALEDQSKCTALHLFLLRSKDLHLTAYVEFLDKLINKDKKNLDIYDIDGDTPLHIAITRGYDLEVIKKLKTSKNVVHHNSQGYIPLHLAIKHQTSLDVIKILSSDVVMRQVFTLSQYQRREKGKSALHLALEWGCSEVVMEFLIGQCREKFTLLLDTEGTALHTALIHMRKSAVVKILKEGTSLEKLVNMLNDYGQTPLLCSSNILYRKFYFIDRPPTGESNKDNQNEKNKNKDNILLFIEEELISFVSLLRQNEIQLILKKYSSTANKIDFVSGLPIDKTRPREYKSMYDDKKKHIWKCFPEEQGVKVLKTIQIFFRELRLQVENKVIDRIERQKLEALVNEIHKIYSRGGAAGIINAYKEEKTDKSMLEEIEKELPNHDLSYLKDINKRPILLMQLLVHAFNSLERQFENRIKELINAISDVSEITLMLLDKGAKDISDKRNQSLRMWLKDIKSIVEEDLFAYGILQAELKQSLKKLDQLDKPLTHTIEKEQKSRFSLSRP